jgi:hypothetical protein
VHGDAQEGTEQDRELCAKTEAEHAEEEARG